MVTATTSCDFSTQECGGWIQWEQSIVSTNARVPAHCALCSVKCTMHYVVCSAVYSLSCEVQCSVRFVQFPVCIIYVSVCSEQ